MRAIKLMFALAFLILAFLGCEQSEALLPFDTNQELKSTETVQMVPFKGKLISAPTSPALIPCNDPVTGAVFPLPINNSVSGNATHLGKLDAMTSTVTVVSCSFDAIAMELTANLDFVFMNKKGDGVTFSGQSVITAAGPSSGNYTITGGFGKFDGATGWLMTSGVADLTTGTTDFSVDGYITQPNH